MPWRQADRDIVARVLAAIANLEGIWENEMRVPLPHRPLLVERAGERWKLDARGYPRPSDALMKELERLEADEIKKKRAEWTPLSF